MRAVVLRGGRLEVRETPDPVPGPGELLLRTLSTAICASDIHYMDHPDPDDTSGHVRVGRRSRRRDGPRVRRRSRRPGAGRFEPVPRRHARHEHPDAHAVRGHAGDRAASGRARQLRRALPRQRVGGSCGPGRRESRCRCRDRRLRGRRGLRGAVGHRARSDPARHRRRARSAFPPSPRSLPAASIRSSSPTSTTSGSSSRSASVPTSRSTRRRGPRMTSGPALRLSGA